MCPSKGILVLVIIPENMPKVMGSEQKTRNVLLEKGIAEARCNNDELWYKK